jgi:23S rRNA pseudouridine1911/1915/1917 synthase
MCELLNIIHQDESLLIVNKPAGLVCHPTKGDAYSSLIGRVRLYLGSDGPIHFINRLDRETSGLVVIAKTDLAARALRRRWERGEVCKTYVAVVEGAVAESRGVIDAPIGPDPLSSVAIKSRVCLNGAPSRTEFQVVSRLRRLGSDYSVLLVSPRTGRKHQIRVHLAHLGHPVVGDKIYGPDERVYLAFVEGRMTEKQWALMKLPNQALHAWQLAWDGEEGRRVYSAEPEEVFLEFMDAGEARLAVESEVVEPDIVAFAGVTRYSDGNLFNLFKSFSKIKLTLNGALGIFAPHTEQTHDTQ